MMCKYSQNLEIVSLEEVLRLDRTELARRNILSIRGRTNEPPLAFPGARRVRTLHFDDVLEDIPQQDLFAARREDLESAIEFGRAVVDQPLLIHCYAGISRSTAVAWILIFDRLKGGPGAVRRAFEIIRDTRPILQPNPHVLRLGIEILVPERTRGKVIQQFQDCLLELSSLRPLLLAPQSGNSAGANRKPTGARECCRYQ
jgi:predicted protein tyrosine phosphatase